MFDTTATLHILMWPAIIIVVIVIVAGIVAVFTEGGLQIPKGKKKLVYNYTAKKYFLTKSERDFYNMLGQAVGGDYRIFAQVHLSSILDEKVKGQDWRAARASINRKSVDYLLCEKNYLSPVLAIELDDPSHDRPDRIVRDELVEAVLARVGLPLLRFRNIGQLTVEGISKKVCDSIAVIDTAQSSDTLRSVNS